MKNQIEIVKEIVKEIADGTKPVLSDSDYTCDCGQVAKIPMCFDCFKKGLERDNSPMLYSANKLTSTFVIKVFAVMFIIGMIAYALDL